jgi:hypothetical protein
MNLILLTLLLTLSAVLAAGAGLLAAADLARVNRETASQLAEAITQRDSARVELRRIREKRHTHQTVAMLEDLSAVHLDILGELRIFYHRMGALLARLQPISGFASEAGIYHREFCTYTRARLRALETIMRAGRRGPFSYIPPAATRPARPGAGRQG